jgi:hypothetical protein
LREPALPHGPTFFRPKPLFGGGGQRDDEATRLACLSCDDLGEDGYDIYTPTHPAPRTRWLLSEPGYVEFHAATLPL